MVETIVVEAIKYIIPAVVGAILGWWRNRNAGKQRDLLITAVEAAADQTLKAAIQQRATSVGLEGGLNKEVKRVTE